MPSTRPEPAARPFHALVNKAGTNRLAGFADVTAEDFDAVMALNLRAAFFAAGIGGAIVHVSSQMGHVGGPQRSFYCASKRAMESMAPR